MVSAQVFLAVSFGLKIGTALQVEVVLGAASVAGLCTYLALLLLRKKSSTGKALSAISVCTDTI